MDDQTARKEVWKGKIAVSFTLDEKEVNYSLGKELPEPVYVSAPSVITPRICLSHTRQSVKFVTTAGLLERVSQ